MKFQIALIVLFVVLLGIVGCDLPDGKKTTAGFTIIEIGGCEYIAKDAGYNGYLAHKGNCKYCAIRERKGK